MLIAARMANLLASVQLSPLSTEYEILLQNLGFPDVEDLVAKQADTQSWPEIHALLERTFAQKTRDEWSFLFEKDACVAPVLRMNEAPLYPHNVQIESFSDTQDPNPAPLLSRTPGRRENHLPTAGEHNVEILEEMGFNRDSINALINRKIVAKL